MDIESIDLPTGISLEYVERGDPSGVPVVFMPGGYDSWRSYEQVLPHLPASFHAFAISPRGHGDSTKPDAGYRIPDYVGDLKAFMDAHRIEAAVHIGHSLSTLVSQRFALDHPERTLGMIQVGADYSVAANPAVEELWEMLFSKMEDPIDPDMVREFQEAALGRPLPAALYEPLVEEPLKIPARVWKAIFKGLMEDDHSDELHKITAPTLIIWGERDEIAPRSEQEALVEAIPDVRFVVYEGLGHSPHWEVPERFAEEVVCFIEKEVRAQPISDTVRQRLAI